MNGNSARFALALFLKGKNMRMKWIGLLWMALLMVGCGSNDQKETSETEGSSAFQEFLQYFPEKQLPYELGDTSLKSGGKDLPAEIVSSFVPDSIVANAPGSSKKVSYKPLARVEGSQGSTFAIIQVAKGSSRSTHLLVYDQNGQFAGSLPFLVPAGKNTRQVSSVDENHNIIRSTEQIQGIRITAEGKNIFAWDGATNSFTWVMTDPLKDDEEIQNPLDTFPQHHKLSGDYVKDKKNVVFIRDGRSPNQLQVFIHTEKNKGECKGELKGDFIVTSSNTAVFRQAGDPCVLQLKFSGNSVSLDEQQGCGNYRGLDCPFDGSFKKKKKTAAAEK